MLLAAWRIDDLATFPKDKDLDSVMISEINASPLFQTFSPGLWNVNKSLKGCEHFSASIVEKNSTHKRRNDSSFTCVCFRDWQHDTFLSKENQNYRKFLQCAPQASSSFSEHGCAPQSFCSQSCCFPNAMVLALDAKLIIISYFLQQRKTAGKSTMQR